MKFLGQFDTNCKHRSKDARLSFGMAVEVKPEEDGQSPRRWLAISLWHPPKTRLADNNAIVGIITPRDMAAILRENAEIL